MSALCKTGDWRAVSRGNADASAANAAGLKIFQFRFALSCVAEIFCINFTWCARYFSQKLRGRIWCPSPAAKSIVKLDINQRQNGDRNGQTSGMKLKRVIAELKTGQNGFRESIKLARIRKLLRNPSSMFPAFVPPLAIAEHGATRNSNLFCVYLRNFFKRILLRITFLIFASCNSSFFFVKNNEYLT